MEPIRLQRIIAMAGITSRRKAEKLIVEGRVRVNGKVVTELGVKADPFKDRIEVDGKRIVPQKLVYYVFYKPRRVVTTLHDPIGRRTVIDYFKGVKERIFPVGRLDYNTSGVLLLTNDGELTYKLLHPKARIPKTYIAKLKGKVPIEKLDMLRNGVELEDGKTAPCELFIVKQTPKYTTIQITIYEGRNRQIHRMAQAIGHPVLKLTRISFAGIKAQGLRPGQWRPLTEKELIKLKKLTSKIKLKR